MRGAKGGGGAGGWWAQRRRAACPSGVGKLLKISPACCHVAQVKRINVIFIRQGRLALRGTTQRTHTHSQRRAGSTHKAPSPQEKIRVLFARSVLRPRETCGCSSRGSRGVGQAALGAKPPKPRGPCEAPLKAQLQGACRGGAQRGRLTVCSDDAAPAGLTAQLKRSGLPALSTVEERKYN